MEAASQVPDELGFRTETVDHLVTMVAGGQVRIPAFSRGFVWNASYVQALFDSIYHGYPIGQLLFFQSPAEASRTRLGPLAVDAPEQARAWWLVDGQQRLTALTICLERPIPLPRTPQPEDPCVLYFDVAKRVFEPPPSSGEIPTTWVPLPKVLDAGDLTTWAEGWEHGRNTELRRRLFEAGDRIRGYRVPLHISKDVEAAIEVVSRLNAPGVPLTREEIRGALERKQASPSTVDELADELTKVGMGRWPSDRLAATLSGMRGVAVPADSESKAIDPAIPEKSLRQDLPILRRVLSFLRRDAGVPHLRLLPKAILLDVLARFFVLHPEPSPRSRALLSRWFWRTVLGAGSCDDSAVRRQGIQAIGETDEEACVQNLLELIDPSRRRSFELPESFDARSDAGRTILASLAHLEPRHLETGQPLDIARLMNEDGEGAFVEIIEGSEVEGTRGAANRILHPKGFQVTRLLLGRREAALFGTSIPASHAISDEALDLLARNDPAGFLAARAETLTTEVRRFADRMAAWEQSDRPSIDYLLHGVEADAS
jgi:hypothetical protein